MVVLEGYIRDCIGLPLVTILVEAFEQRGFVPNPQLDANLGSEVTDNRGYFSINIQREIDEIDQVPSKRWYSSNGAGIAEKSVNSSKGEF
jgi:hypothetical protein